LKERAI